MDERVEWISKRAYSLWEATGRPWGLSERHWEQASREWDMKEQTRASTDGREVLGKHRRETNTERVGDDYEDAYGGTRRVG